VTHDALMRIIVGTGVVGAAAFPPTGKFEADSIVFSVKQNKARCAGLQLWV